MRDVWALFLEFRELVLASREHRGPCLVLLEVRRLELGVVQVLMCALKRLNRVSNGILVYLISLVRLLHPVSPISAIFINLIKSVVLRRTAGLKFYDAEGLTLI